MENHTNHFPFKLDTEIEKLAEQASKAIEDQIERLAQEKYEKMAAEFKSAQKDKQIPEGCRKITVYYNPKDNIDDHDYVKIEVEPENDEEGMNDTIALLLAAAKRLSGTCHAVNEGLYGTELLDATEEYMKATVLGQLLGGAMNGRN